MLGNGKLKIIMEEFPIWEICCVFKAPLVASLHFVALTHIVPKRSSLNLSFPKVFSEGVGGLRED